MPTKRLKREASQPVRKQFDGCLNSRNKVSMERVGVPMWRISTWLVALWIGVCSASGQEATSTDDLRKGHQLAIMVCAFCHVAAPDQARMPILDPPATSFESIAQRTDINAEWLENFISTTHRGLDNPSGMPNPSLLDNQIKQVTAYLLSLRK